MKRALLLLLSTLCFVAGASASDWSNSGGGPERNGRSREVGPDSFNLLWAGAPSSVISWQPVTEGNRVFMVRQTGFPSSGEPNGSPVIAKDLTTGATLWTVNIPFNAGDWTTWIAGVKDGRVYCSRSGNGGSVSAKLYCLDAATGATLWISQENQNVGAYDGVVFAPDGDPILGSYTRIWRINSTDGTTVWSTPRTGSVSGHCGVCLSGSAVYSCDVVPGGQAIKRFDLNTGILQYTGPTMVGFLLQNTPMAGPTGEVYLSRVQNNSSVDFFFAFEDTGSGFVQLWNAPAAYSTWSEFAVGHDNSVYMFAPGNILERRDGRTGALINSFGPVIADQPLAPRFALDAVGRVYFSNGGFANGRVYAFDHDLTLRGSFALPNINIGGPVLGQGGVLLVSGTGTDVRAFRTNATIIPGCFGDGSARACPCNNQGVIGRGCANSQVNSQGALLMADGDPGNDSVRLEASGMLPTALCIFLQGSLSLSNPFVFGDGLRCAGGQLLRLSVKNGVNGTARYPEQSELSIRDRNTQLGFPIGPGASTIYQTYYRDPVLGFCPNPPGNSWNVTNSLRVNWP